MSRRRVLWLAAVVVLAVLVAVQVITSLGDRAQFIARADIPTVVPGVDVLAGIAVVPLRIRGFDYRRDAFGDTWTDVDKTYVSIKRCPTAVATGTLHDPYTNAVVAFTRGNQVGASVQIDHLVSAAVMRQTAIHAGQHVDDMPPTSVGA